MRGTYAGIVVVASALAGGRARADTPIVDRNYAIELYDGAVIGNDTTVGMGGAAVANANGSSGTLVNPSAPAVRVSTDTDHWSWDYHLGYLNSSLSTDYDNNGNASSDGTGTSVFTIGVALRVGDWAGALTGTQQSARTAGDMPLLARTTRAKLAIARWIDAWDVAIGGALQVAEFELRPDCEGAGCASLFTINGTGLELGATWIPRAQSFRIGAEAASPIEGGNVAASSCADASNCEGYILPDEIVSAWRVSAGGAYRLGPTAWNQAVHAPWRDERALTAAADVVLVGAAPNAYGLEAFGAHELQRSGRSAALSVRAGVDYEWLPGRLRVRAGSYWEPGRYDGVGGRLHATFGTQLRVFEFQLYGPRRGQLTLTGDVASRYRNVGLSVGFWH